MKHRITIKRKFNKYGRLLELQIIVHYISKRLESDCNEKKTGKEKERQENLCENSK